VPIATGQPAAFLAALSERDDWRDLLIFGGLMVEPYPVLQKPGVRCISGFFGPLERALAAAGANVDYLPADFLGWERYARSAAPRVIATAAAPMDERGYFSLGLHAGATFTALVAAARDPQRLAIIEVMADMPHVFGLAQYGGHRLHVTEIDCVIESDRTPLALPGGADQRAGSDHRRPRRRPDRGRRHAAVRHRQHSERRRPAAGRRQQGRLRHPHRDDGRRHHASATRRTRCRTTRACSTASRSRPSPPAAPSCIAGWTAIRKCACCRSPR
jgi:hypothetical protein